MPNYIELFRERNKNAPVKKLVDTYYDLLNQIWQDKKNKDYKKMLIKCEMSLSLIEPLIIETKNEFGSMDLPSIPAIEVGVNFWAILKDDKNLNIVREIVGFFPELEGWKAFLEKAFVMKELSSKIYNYVKDNEGCLQKELKKKLGLADGRAISNTIYYMELLKQISRKKQGDTFSLSVC